LLEERHTKVRCAPSQGGGRTCVEGAKSKARGKGFHKVQVGKGKGKGISKEKVKAQGKRSKGYKSKRGAPRQSAPCFKRLAGTSSRDSKASKKGCYCTRFTCICFPCCTFCFEAFYIHLLQTGFPHGGFSRVMLTKNLCVNFMHS
jgi:hypothetical protein